MYLNNLNTIESDCDSDSSIVMGDESELMSDTNDDDMQMEPDRQLYKSKLNAPTNEFTRNALIEHLEAQIYQEH